MSHYYTAPITALVPPQGARLGAPHTQSTLPTSAGAQSLCPTHTTGAQSQWHTHTVGAWSRCLIVSPHYTCTDPIIDAPWAQSWCSTRQGGREGACSTNIKTGVFSLCLQCVLTVFSYFTTSKQGGREDLRLISKWTCSQLELTVPSTCSHLVPTVFSCFTTGKEGMEGGFLTNIKMDVFSPCSHHVLTLYSPYSLISPLARTEGGRIFE